MVYSWCKWIIMNWNDSGPVLLSSPKIHSLIIMTCSQLCLHAHTATSKAFMNSMCCFITSESWWSRCPQHTFLLLRKRFFLQHVLKSCTWCDLCAYGWGNTVGFYSQLCLADERNSARCVIEDTWSSVSHFIQRQLYIFFGPNDFNINLSETNACLWPISENIAHWCSALYGFDLSLLLLKSRGLCRWVGGAQV